MKKIIFMGTPEFAVDSLQALAASEDYDLVAVVTQPDKPVGRKGKLTPPAVKVAAEEAGLPVYQPENIQDPEAVEKLLSYQPDLIITAAYGQILPVGLLEAPEFGAINIHASLLPKYRGAAPIHYAVLNGDPMAGVTIMYMEEGLDTGDMLAKREIEIQKEDDTGSLFVKLAQIGKDLMLETLPLLFDRQIVAEPQDESQATYAPSISKTQEKIDWNQTADRIAQKIKALRPEPGAYSLIEGQRFKIWDAEAAEETTTLSPGTVCRVEKKQFYVACGKGTVLKIKEVQPAGKKRMPAVNYLNGAGQFIEKGWAFDVESSE